MFEAQGQALTASVLVLQCSWVVAQASNLGTKGLTAAARRSYCRLAQRLAEKNVADREIAKAVNLQALHTRWSVFEKDCTYAPRTGSWFRKLQGLGTPRMQDRTSAQILAISQYGDHRIKDRQMLVSRYGANGFERKEKEAGEESGGGRGGGDRRCSNAPSA